MASVQVTNTRIKSVFSLLAIIFLFLSFLWEFVSSRPSSALCHPQTSPEKIQAHASTEPLSTLVLSVHADTPAHRSFGHVFYAEVSVPIRPATYKTLSTKR